MIAVLIFSLLAFTAAQTCIDSGVGPCNDVAPQCPTGFTCAIGTPSTVGAVCCNNINLVLPCVDKVNPQTGVSDCSRSANLCNDPVYFNTMTVQCPRTCNRCPGTPTPTCVDKINPQTGRSDCPQRANLCNNSAYFTLMTDQCPRTCGRCSGK